MLQINGSVFGGDAIDRLICVKVGKVLYEIDCSEEYTTDDFRKAFLASFLGNYSIFATVEFVREVPKKGFWDKYVYCKMLEYRMMEGA